MATTLVKEKEIKNLIRRTVIESVQGVLTDPDYGLELNERFAARLKKELEVPSKKLKPLAEIK